MESFGTPPKNIEEETMTEIKDTDLMMITAGGGKSLLNLKMLESTLHHSNN